MTKDEIDAFFLTLSSAERAAFIKIGRHYSSQLTLAQGNKTLNACRTYGGLIAPRGFGQAKIDRLQWAVDALGVAGVTREEAKAGAKSTNVDLRNEVLRGKSLRFDLLAQAEGAIDDVRNTPGGAELVSDIQAALNAARSSGYDAVELADQLDLLSNLTSRPELVAVLDASSPQTAADAKASALKLRALEAATTNPAGTPADTERLDLLDGLILRLVRQARKSGRAASRSQGTPAIAQAFALDELYGPGPKPAPTPVPVV